MSMNSQPLAAAATTPAVVVYVPVELLHLICEAADRSALYSIALASKTFNAIATPALYSNIDLQLIHAIYACIRTLATPPSRTAMNRDLASLVDTISLHDTYDKAIASTFKSKHCGAMRRRLANAVPRMRRLRSFTVQIGLYFSAEIFMTLASGTLPLVQGIDVDVSLPEYVALAPLAATARDLRTFRLRSASSSIPTTYTEYIGTLLAANRDTLLSLSLPFVDASVLQSGWPAVHSFPALRELHVPGRLLSQPAFQNSSSIRSLVIARFWDHLELAPTALPNLEEVSCWGHQLEALLPQHADHRRPIRTVKLNQAEYGVPRFQFTAELFGMEGWHVVNDPAIRSLRFSGAPLVYLSFFVAELSRAVPPLEDVVPLLQRLEYLYIFQQVHRIRAEDAYGSDEVAALAPLLERMPCLHTFLLSFGRTDGSFDFESVSEFANDEDLQRRMLSVYDQHSSSLKRAAFTSKLEWEKREDGWHPWGRVVAEREIHSEGEDEG